jgi:uncharacterized protein
MDDRSAKVLRGAVMCIAKTPRPGRSKTRLCPPLTPDEACDVAWACLLDSLDAIATVAAERHVLVLDGEPGPWIPPDFEVIPQRGDGLGDRLAAAFIDVGATAVVIAMDTPQVTGELLGTALAALDHYDVVYGPAADGGYWLIGLGAHVAAAPVFKDVPMSSPATGAAQLATIAALGLSVHRLETLRDIDDIADLKAVAALARDSRLATLMTALSSTRTS